MKIGLFTDSHYSSQEVTCGCRYNNQSLRKIREAYTAFEAADCDLVICLGDLTDKEDAHQKEAENLREIAELIAASPIPTVCVMGNHDAFTMSAEEFYGILSGCVPENRELDGKQLLFLDACYYQSGEHYAPGDDLGRWTDTCYPFLDELEQVLSATTKETYIFLHQSVDPAIREDHRLHNADLLAKLFARCGKVKAVYQGHYHPGMESEHDGIRYITLPAMCERENAYFILTL